MDSGGTSLARGSLNDGARSQTLEYLSSERQELFVKINGAADLVEAEYALSVQVISSSADAQTACVAPR